MKKILILFLVLISNQLLSQGTTCGTATTLVLDGPCLSATITDATANNPAPSCGTQNREGWYTFTLAANTNITIAATANRNLAVQLISGTCGAPVETICEDSFGGGVNTETISTNLNAGTYYIKILNVAGTANNMNLSSLCLTTTIPFSNDDACSATPLTVGASCSMSASTNVGATDSGIGSPSCSSYGGEDAWYSVVVPASGHLVFDSDIGSITDGGFALYTGACNSLTEIDCNDDGSTNGLMPMIDNSSLTPGSTVYLRFWEFGGGTGTFSLCVYDGGGLGSGSTCGSAFVIPSLPYSASSQTTCGYGDDYSSSDACGSYYMDGDDFVYSYTPSTNESIDITLTNTSTWVGLFVTQGCPDLGGSSCIAFDEQSGGDPSLGCVALTAGVTYYIIISTDPSPQCTPFDISISASTSSAPSCNLDYTISDPGFSTTTGGGWTSLSFSDDEFATTLTNIGFSFCFDNVYYTQTLVSSNGYIVFPSCYTVIPNGDAVPTGYSPWEILAAVPNTNDAPRNAIMLTWQDIDPGVTGSGNIRYKVTGTSPNRVFVLQYPNIRMYDCTSLNYSGELRLYETSNIIEFAIGEKTICSTWNDEAAILGLHNYSGTVAVVPAGHNYVSGSPWSETNQGYRFTPNCACSNPLAIEMVDVSALGRDHFNEIFWNTSFDDEISNFVIEKSIDGRNFSVLASINPKNESYSEYSFIHNNPENNRMYYRVRVTDFFGNAQYSRTVVVSKSDNYEISNVWPVPMEDKLNVSVYSPLDVSVNIEFTDVTGRIFSQNEKTLFEGDNTLLLQTNMLSSGVYYLVIKDKKGTVLVGKSIIKE